MGEAVENLRFCPMRVLPVALVVVLAACGAKTGLVPPGGAGGGAGTGPLAVKCTSAQQDGAPTPTRGFCPTRSNQAPFAGPQSPEIAWSARPFPVTDPENYLPAEIVVDAAGRSYVLVDASPINTAGGPNRLAALDANGNTVWTQSFDRPAGGLSLGRDGTLWAVEQPPPTNVVGTTDAGTDDGVVVGVTAGGALASTFDLPQAPPPPPPYSAPGIAYADLAIASDGSFFLEAIGTNLYGAGALARVSPGGAVLWQWPPPQPYGPTTQLGGPLVLTPDDGIIARGNPGVLAFESDGVQTWQSNPAQVIAVDANGSVLALTASESGGAISLVTLDANGTTTRTVSLGSPQVTIDASQLAIAGDGTDLVLLADEVSTPTETKTHVTVTAIDPSGSTRWTATLDVALPYDPAALSTHYGLFVDAAGTVVVTAGTVTGIDLASGTVLWTLQPPNTRSCLRPAVLGAGGAIVASQCDGTIFLARDP